LETLAGDDSAPPAAAPWPDQLAVQFPLSIPEGMERPYFLMGSTSQPVYQWRWSSASAGGAAAGLARGIEQFDPVPGGALAGQAVYDRGEWHVTFTRSLATADSSQQLQFRTGHAIPVAFFVRDGSNGESGSRVAVSTWYFLSLDTPTSPRVFVSPVLAMVLTLGLGWTVVRRAQRRAGPADSAAGRPVS
jgi:DMSO reductase family type II enzyme heme b subunit